MYHQWLRCSQRHLPVLPGRHHVRLHLRQGSSQGHVGRSVSCSAVKNCPIIRWKWLFEEVLYPRLQPVAPVCVMFDQNRLMSNRTRAAVTQLWISPVNVFTCRSDADEWLSGRRPRCSISSFSGTCLLAPLGMSLLSHAGWTMECLQEWGPFIQLAIPSMLMLCLEWWLFEVGGFLAGVISEAELGSQSIIYELTVVAYMVKKKNVFFWYSFFFGLGWQTLWTSHQFPPLCL